MKEFVKKVIGSSGMFRFLFVKFQNSRRMMMDKNAVELSKMSRAGDHGGVFAHIYKNKFWQSKESVSGWGSTLEITEPLRPKLERMLKDYKVKSFLDVPCGDFNWMKALNFGSVKYIGGDIVKELIDDLNQKYAGANKEFIVLDLVNDHLPEVDMIFIRDCFIHLENGLVQKALANIAKSKITYAVITHDPGMVANMNIETGQFRDVNLCKTPFNLPAPVEIINEGCTDPLLVDKSLGIWKVADIRKVYDR